MKTITYSEYKELYTSGKLLVYINKAQASSFVLSEFADKHNKPALLFWLWVGRIVTFVLPIIIGFKISWVYAIGVCIIGIIIINSNKKSAEQFVVENMLSSEDFWDYVLLHKGAMIKDLDGNEVKSAFLEKMSNRKNS